MDRLLISLFEKLVANHSFELILVKTLIYKPVEDIRELSLIESLRNGFGEGRPLLLVTLKACELGIVAPGLLCLDVFFNLTCFYVIERISLILAVDKSCSHEFCHGLLNVFVGNDLIFLNCILVKAGLVTGHVKPEIYEQSIFAQLLRISYEKYIGQKAVINEQS